MLLQQQADRRQKMYLTGKKVLRLRALFLEEGWWTRLTRQSCATAEGGSVWPNRRGRPQAFLIKFCFITIHGVLPD